MAFADWFSTRSPLRLEGGGVILRPYRSGDYAEWAEVRLASRDFLQPWEPIWPEDDLTRAGFRRRLLAYQREIELGTGFPFLVFRDGRLVGGISLNNVRRGIAQMGSVGYWSSVTARRQGNTLAGVRVLAEFAFGPLGLHRLEAACVPTNEASKNLLLKAGFRQEGYAAAYLKINGEWRDHLTFGLLASEFRPLDARS
jgi:ribosomal-protein-alanine N-acetyltransferase